MRKLDVGRVERKVNVRCLNPRDYKVISSMRCNEEEHQSFRLIMRVDVHSPITLHPTPIKAPSPNSLATLPSSLNIAPTHSLAPCTSLAPNFTTTALSLRTRAAVQSTPSAFSCACLSSLHFSLGGISGVCSSTADLPIVGASQFRAPIRVSSSNSEIKKPAKGARSGPVRIKVPMMPRGDMRGLSPLPSSMTLSRRSSRLLCSVLLPLSSCLLAFSGSFSLWATLGVGVMSQTSFLPLHPPKSQLSPRARRPSLTQSRSPRLAPGCRVKIWTWA